MSQFNNIFEFNTYLSEQSNEYSLFTYFKEIHFKFYSDIDISFMEYFLELMKYENEFIVEHQKLKEYGVLTNIETTKDINRRLQSLMLIENEDYQVGNVAQVRIKSTGENTGNVIKKEYKLKPSAFKLCLIRSKNSKKYAKYYLLLEKVFKYYQDYQVLYNKNINKHLSNENKTLNKKIDELLGYARETKELNEELNDKVDNLQDTVEDIKESFRETSDRSVPDPNEPNERHEFILLQHKELTNKFKFIRGIQKYNDSKILKKYSEYNIIKREFNANPIQLFKQFKETIKEYYKLEKEKITANKNLKNKMKLKREIEKIKFIGNDITLQYNYTLNELLDYITEVSNERFSEYNNYSVNP